MTYSKVLFSSKSVEWPTPVSFFEKLNDEFKFTLDPCATPENAKCKLHFTMQDDGLLQDWGSHRVFCNPPYGRTIRHWTQKCYEASRNGALVVMLVPSSTGTRWFHNWVLGKAEIRFVQGRLKFGDSKSAAPFSSIVAVYRPAAANDNRETQNASYLKAVAQAR